MAAFLVFFSRTDENYVSGQMKYLTVGNTERVAAEIHRLTGAEEFRIEMKHPYSKEYNECINEARDDQRKNARPELTGMPESLDSYDTIYLGYPIYWGTAPMAVFTFLEHYDFSGKTIRPFCTHEGSGLGGSLADIRKACPGARVEKGLAVHGSRIDASKKEIQDWVNRR